MTHDLTASNARTVSTTDLNVYNEIDFIGRKVIAESLLGNLSVTIDDGTTMTDSTPAITVTGTVANPVFTANDTLILAGQTITLGNDGTDGTGLNQAIADINDAAVAGLTASKNISNQLVLTYDPPQTTWSFAIGAGTANTDLGLTASTATPSDPASLGYYSVWSGGTDDRKDAHEMTQVVNHFQQLGYSILQKKNIATGNTFLWEVYW